MTASEQAAGQAQRWVLQFCHGYDGPFLDCARQYAVLFKGTPYKVCTVYLTGKPSAEVERGSASDEVIFLDYSSAQVRGLKLGAVRDFRRIAASRDFALCIAHRFKPIYVALLGSDLPVIGVHHAFGDYKRRSRQLFANFSASAWRCLGCPMQCVTICAPVCLVGRPSVSRPCTTASMSRPCRPSRYPARLRASI